MIEIRPFSLHDVPLKMAGAVPLAPSQFIGQLVVAENCGMAFSGYDEGQWVGSAGIIPYAWKSAGEAWMLLDSPKKVLSVIKALKTYLTTCIEIMGLSRLATTVKADNIKGIRLVKMLGFVEEGLMRQYGPDKTDYFLFSIVR